MIRMCWRDMQLLAYELPTGCVSMGERKRLIMPRGCQYAWLHCLFPERMLHGKEGWQLWLETDDASFQAGSRMFLERVAVMLHHRGIIANLSLRENLLLPFLYHGGEDALKQAEQHLPEIAVFLGLSGTLDEQAGERSAYTHGIISLGRCMLQKPDVVVAQDVHCGMPPHRLQRFRELFLEAMASLQAGMLYLSTSEYDGSGIMFEDSLELCAINDEVSA